MITYGNEVKSVYEESKITYGIALGPLWVANRWSVMLTDNCPTFSLTFLYSVRPRSGFSCRGRASEHAPTREDDPSKNI